MGYSSNSSNPRRTARTDRRGDSEAGRSVTGRVYGRYHVRMAGDPAVPPLDNGFEVVRKGYEQGQVDTHLRRLDAEIRILTTDRDAAVDQSVQLARELDEARVRAEKLRAHVGPPKSVQGMSERMRSMLRLAEDEVDEMLSRAKTEVNRRTREADLQAAQTIAAAQAEADAVRFSAHADAERVGQDLARARAELEAKQQATHEQLTADRAASEQRIAADAARAEQEQARVWAESEARRTLVEEDFTIAMDQRRAEALEGLAAERLEAQREIDKLQESAAATARAIVANVKRQVAELIVLRKRIIEQLDGMRTVLEGSLDVLTPLPEKPAKGSQHNGATTPNGSTAGAAHTTSTPEPATDERDAAGDDTRSAGPKDTSTRRPTPHHRAAADVVIAGTVRSASSTRP